LVSLFEVVMSTHIPEILLTYKNVTRTLAEWSLVLKITPSAMRYRLRQYEKTKNLDALFRPRYTPSKRKEWVYTFEGRELTAPEWARELGITAETFYTRVRRYPSPSDPRRFARKGDMELTPSSDRAGRRRPPCWIKPVIIDGKVMSMSAYARSQGVTVSAISRRVSRTGSVFLSGERPDSQSGKPGAPRCIELEDSDCAEEPASC
jgi:hypothetical protein